VVPASPKHRRHATGWSPGNRHPAALGYGNQATAPFGRSTLVFVVDWSASAKSAAALANPTS